MIKINNSKIIAMYINGLKILSVYTLGLLVWPEDITEVLSCFSNGYWVDEYPWIDNVSWEN